MESPGSVWRGVLGLIIISPMVGFALVPAVGILFSELRGLFSKEKIYVEAIIESIRLENRKEYSDVGNRIESVEYTLSIESVYSTGGKFYSYVESYSTDDRGKLFTSLEPVLKLTQKLSPFQPITLWPESEFSGTDKEFLYKQDLRAGIKGRRTLKISKQDPGTVIQSTKNSRTTILASLFGITASLALLLAMSYFNLKNASSAQFTILFFVLSLGLASGISISAKWFWHGGKNTSIYDPNKPEDIESLTIYRSSTPS